MIYSIKTGFNTTLVQLKVDSGWVELYADYIGFNTTLVQLKVWYNNSMAQTVKKFQYHSGPIKSIKRFADENLKG